MTTSEQIAYDNGFILGMASKGVIQKTIIIEGDGDGIDKVLSWDRHDSFALVLTPVMILDYTPIV